MRFVIMGCGRVGSTLARALQEHHHDVSVIDRHHEAFRRLGASFEGRTIEGEGFDREVLKEAGIEDAYAFAAVSSGDNSNILAARVARERFNVPNVVARIYDPRRAEVYQRLGIPTVATVRWTSDQVMRRLLPHHLHAELTDASGHLMIAEVPLHESWFGHPLHSLEAAAQVRVAYVTRYGEGTIPTLGMMIQEGDVVHVVMPVNRSAEVERIVMQAPEVQE